MLPGMSDGWRRLGEMIETTRTRRWRTRQEFARVTGISVRTIADLEKGARSRYLPATLAGIEAALGWDSGSCLRIVAGGRPKVVGDAQLERIADLWPRLSPDAQALVVRVVEVAAHAAW